MLNWYHHPIPIKYPVNSIISSFKPTLLNVTKRLDGQKFIFSESPAMCKSKKQYQQQSNNVLDFIDCCLEDANPEDSAAFKDLYDCYQGFCATEGNKKCFPKKEFRTILEKEGIKVANSSKHANQVRVFGVKYEVVYE